MSKKGEYHTDPATRYFGKVCAKHPELEGLRRRKTRSCPACESARAKACPKRKVREAINRAANVERKRASRAIWKAANVERIRATDAAWEAANVERRKATAAIWRAANLEKIRAYELIYRAANVEKRKARYVAWRAANLEKIRERSSVYAKANRGKRRKIKANYRALKIKASVTWANLFYIEEIYELAVLRSKATGITHHVDHIVPLNSKIVCGLHCEANLQVIPGASNVSKGNRYWPDMPS